MLIPEDHPRFVFVPEEDASEPIEGLAHIYLNRWWSVHPSKGLVFWDKKAMSPQCNSSEFTARKITADLYPWAECRFIPVVYRRAHASDFA